MRTLLIGGSRSGKSSLAVRWAAERSQSSGRLHTAALSQGPGWPLHVCCIVTAVGSDPEMAARIEAHSRERPASWRVREAPVHLGDAIREEGASGALVVVDCLTVWTANCLWPEAQVAGRDDSGASRDADLVGWQRERDDLLAALRNAEGPAILVTNEVGTGIVPDNAAARIFRDEHGWLNQAVAAVCDEVFLVTAGLPLRLKPTG